MQYSLIRFGCFIAIIVLSTSNLQSSNPNNHFQASALTANQTDIRLAHAISAEMALNRQQYETSFHYYWQLANQSQDPELAQRATQLALTVDDMQLAFNAAKLWATLAPKNYLAQRTAINLAIRSDQLQESEIFLSNLLRDRQSEAIIDLLMITAQLNPGDKLRLLDTLLVIQKQDPQYTEMTLAIALLQFDTQQLDLAQKNVSTVLDKEPNWIAAIALQSEIFIVQENFEQAINYLAIQIKNNPDNDLRFIYAQTLMELQQLLLAKEQFFILSKTEKYAGLSLINLAKISISQNQLKQAENYLQQATTDVQYQENAWYLLGRLAEFNQKNALAVKYYNFIHDGKYYFSAHIRIAKILADVGEIEKARLQLGQIRVTSDEEFRQTRLLETDILLEENLLEQAFNSINIALTISPTDVDLLYQRSLIAERLNRLDIAEQDLNAILNDDPEHVQALNTLGYTLVLYTERYQEALTYIEKALSLEPNNPAILDSMGWVQYRLGNKQAALNYLTKAYSLSTDAEIAAHFGEVLWINGRKKDARKVWRKALDKNPNNILLRQTVDSFIKK